MAICEHANVGFFLEPSVHEDTNVVVLRLSMTCDHCHKRFRFLGIDEREQIPALMQPRLQNGGMIACLPMVAENEIPRLAVH